MVNGDSLGIIFHKQYYAAWATDACRRGDIKFTCENLSSRKRGHSGRLLVLCLAKSPVDGAWEAKTKRAISLKNTHLRFESGAGSFRSGGGGGWMSVVSGVANVLIENGVSFDGLSWRGRVDSKMP